MTTSDLLRTAHRSVEVNEAFSEAVLLLSDGSRLCFCHRVGERWAKAVNPDQAAPQTTLAQAALAQVSMFRLNAKHLDVQFVDGSRYELGFRGSGRQSPPQPD